jgi:hypothetical protein
MVIGLENEPYHRVSRNSLNVMGWYYVDHIIGICLLLATKMEGQKSARVSQTVWNQAAEQLATTFPDTSVRRRTATLMENPITPEFPNMQ